MCVLEKLLITQHEHEERVRFYEWLEKMNDLDFYKRTRSFFSELRKRHKISQKATGSYKFQVECNIVPLKVKNVWNIIANNLSIIIDDSS